tara:strand:+ start:2304 stop:2465 length:162 start_codon:yes stop_codon:yes gene_type:complete
MAVINFVFCYSGKLIETTEAVNNIFLYSIFPYQLRVRKFRRNLLIYKYLCDFI